MSAWPIPFLSKSRAARWWRVSIAARIAIADAGGAISLALGDIETPIYPRSSLKPIQALPLVESGAADAFGLSDEEVALACASHSGEPMHTDARRRVAGAHRLRGSRSGLRRAAAAL